MRVNYRLQDVKATYLDEYTREPLPYSLVMQAIQEELEYVNNNVWELSDAQKAIGDAEAKTIRTRWVICNKGDAACPDIRARLVATELNTYKSDDFFASTPPLEAKRLLFPNLQPDEPTGQGKGCSCPLRTSARPNLMACQSGSSFSSCRGRWGNLPRPWHA